MAIANYADLLSDVADYLDRNDLTSKIPDFVIMAESLFNYGDKEREFNAIRSRDMETIGTATPSSGAVTISGNVLDMIRVVYKSDPRVTLEYVSPTSLDEMYGTTNSGDPKVYTLLGTTLSFRPTGGSDIEYVYYTKIPPLVDNLTNWLMTANPQAYIFATLYYAHIFLKDPEAALAMLQLTRGALGGLAQTNLFNRSGSMSVRSHAVAW